MEDRRRTCEELAVSSSLAKDVSKTASAHGVFLADLDGGLAARMRDQTSRLIDGDDRLHIFALCGECSARTVVHGAGALPRDESFYVL